MELKTFNELLSSLENTVQLDTDHSVQILNPEKIRNTLIDQLVWTAVFVEDAHVREAARWLIRAIGEKLGVSSSSIQPLYEAMGAKKVSGFTVPAINIRGITYDVAQAILRANHSLQGFPVIFEIAKSEIGYTFQQPAEYAAVIIAAAIKEKYEGPLYIQGDHFQVNAKKYAAEPAKELKGIYDLIDEALEAGFYNIDIDTSTLVDLSFQATAEQQRVNFERCAEFTKYIREKQPAGVMVSVGGEIGEVGMKNSTVEELTAFMEGYNSTLRKIAPTAKGISKMSVQTGTSHGGIPLPDGSVAKVKLDFETLEKLSDVARNQYGLSGAVQHGASTLPDELFDKFLEVKASEIHLATGFQNMIYDHPEFPDSLKQEIYHYLEKNFADEKKDGETREQFLYKTRKKGFGPFKRQLWSLPESIRSAIGKALEEKFVLLFKKLGIAGKRAQLIEFAPKHQVKVEAPLGLRQ